MWMVLGWMVVMRSCRFIVLTEFAVLVVVLLVQLVIDAIFNMSAALSNGMSSFLQSCLDINSALIIAILVVAISERRVSIKGRRLKLIEKNTIVLVFVNSFIMAFACVVGYFGLALVMGAMYGNLKKILDLYKYAIE